MYTGRGRRCAGVAGRVVLFIELFAARARIALFPDGSVLRLGGGPGVVLVVAAEPAIPSCPDMPDIQHSSSIACRGASCQGPRLQTRQSSAPLNPVL